MHAAAGRAFVDGGSPYRDVWEIKGPLVYLIWAAAEELSGGTPAAIRAIDLLFHVAGSAFVGWLVASLSTPAAGRTAALTLFVAQTTLGWFHASQSEGWAATMITAGLSPLLVRGVPGPGLALTAAAGLLIGATAAFKPLFLLFAVIPLLAVRSWNLKCLAAYGGCLLVVPAIAVAPVVTRGAWAFLVECHLVYNLESYSGIDRFDGIAAFRRIAGYFLFERGAVRFESPTWWLALPVVVVGASMVRHLHWRIAAAIGAWLGIAVLVVAVQGRFYLYHWLPAFPPLVVLASLGAARLQSTIQRPDAAARQRWAARSAAGMFAVFLAIAALVPARDVAIWIGHLTAVLPEEQYLAQFWRFDYVARDGVAAGAHIRQNSDPLDTVANLSPAAAVAYMAGRRAPGRFVYPLPLSSENAQFREAYRREFLRAMRDRPPLFIVTQPRTTTPLLGSFPELGQFVATNYDADRSFGNITLLRRRDTPRDRGPR